MCLINADFFPNHLVSCCEINSVPQNQEELEIVMIPGIDLFKQHMNPNMQLINFFFSYEEILSFGASLHSFHACATTLDLSTTIWIYLINFSKFS